MRSPEEPLLIVSLNLAEISDAQTDISGCSRITGFFAGMRQVGVWTSLRSSLVSHPATCSRQALSHLTFFWLCIAHMWQVSSARIDASLESKRTGWRRHVKETLDDIYSVSLDHFTPSISWRSQSDPERWVIIKIAKIYWAHITYQA